MMRLFDTTIWADSTNTPQTTHRDVVGMIAAAVDLFNARHHTNLTIAPPVQMTYFYEPLGIPLPSVASPQPNDLVVVILEVPKKIELFFGCSFCYASEVSTFEVPVRDNTVRWADTMLRFPGQAPLRAENTDHGPRPSERIAGILEQAFQAGRLSAG